MTPRVALAHDFITVLGGAERVLESFHALYPDAPIHALVYHAEDKPDAYRGMEIRDAPSLRNPIVRRYWKAFLPLYPAAMESFSFEGYDVVLSSSYAFAKGVLTAPETCHISYCHTPMRFAWTMYGDYLGQYSGRLSRLALAPIISYLRLWDFRSAQRVDAFIANSRNVARRIWKYYRRRATVIHPPVDTSRFVPSSRLDDYYLVVSRLVLPSKPVDLAVEAFNRLGWPLKIIGTGSHAGYLKSIAHSNVEFLGEVSSDVLAEAYARCRGFVFCGEDDFGLTPIEAMASGRPVLAYGAGGALESVVPGVTGAFFTEPSVEALVAALQSFEPESFDAAAIRRHAEQYDVALFRERIRAFVERQYAEHCRRFMRP